MLTSSLYRWPIHREFENWRTDSLFRLIGKFPNPNKKIIVGDQSRFFPVGALFQHMVRSVVTPGHRWICRLWKTPSRYRRAYSFPSSVQGLRLCGPGDSAVRLPFSSMNSTRNKYVCTLETSSTPARRGRGNRRPANRPDEESIQNPSETVLQPGSTHRHNRSKSR